MLKGPVYASFFWSFHIIFGIVPLDNKKVQPSMKKSWHALSKEYLCDWFEFQDWNAIVAFQEGQAHISKDTAS